MSRLFVSVPIIADNPKYGWHIIGKTKFSSEKKANCMISDLEEILQEIKDEKYVECYLFDGMIGCSHLKSESCDHACHLNQMENKS